MTDGSSIICAGATLDAASLLLVRSAGCTKAVVLATRTKSAVRNMTLILQARGVQTEQARSWGMWGARLGHVAGERG